MSSYNFPFNGRTFSIKVPQGTTEEQARALFQQQVGSGSLTGLKIGSTVSAATQAAGGLNSLAQVTQQAASLRGQIPANANLNSITASIGGLGQTALSQLSKAQVGSAAAFNSLTTGASAASAGVGRLLSAGSTGLTALAGQSAGILTSPLIGAAATSGSLASTAVATATKAVNTTVTNGINVADVAKQGPALGSIGNLSTSDVTGTLAQTVKTVGQRANEVSNTAGVGKFGLDVNQLEKAGLVKPGTASQFLANGQNAIDVLKSPTVWTGKDGVKGLSNVLDNPGLQNKVQQDLMKTGINEIKTLGVPTDKLSPQALSGLATNAAKNVPDTIEWAKNSPGLSQAVKSSFDTTAANSSFAVSLVNKKVDAAVLQETQPVAAKNTVNTETVDAASNRIVGNSKVPDITRNASV
jgi:hypothetical protein